jgi:hypothetical protein
MSDVKLGSNDVLKLIPGKPPKAIQLAVARTEQAKSIKDVTQSLGKVFVVYEPGRVAGPLTEVRKWIKGGKSVEAQEAEEVTVEEEVEMEEGPSGAVPPVTTKDLDKATRAELFAWIQENGGDTSAFVSKNGNLKPQVKKDLLLKAAKTLKKKLDARGVAASPVITGKPPSPGKAQQVMKLLCANKSGKPKCKKTQWCNVESGKCVEEVKKTGKPARYQTTEKAVLGKGKKFIISEEKGLGGKLFGASESVLQHLEKFGLVHPVTEESRAPVSAPRKQKPLPPVPGKRKPQPSFFEEEIPILAEEALKPAKKGRCNTESWMDDEYEPCPPATPDCDWETAECLPSDVKGYYKLTTVDGRTMISKSAKVIMALQHHLPGSKIVEQSVYETVAEAEGLEGIAQELGEEVEEGSELLEEVMGTQEAVREAAREGRVPVAPGPREEKGKEKEPAKTGAPAAEGAGPVLAGKKAELVERFKRCIGQMQK